MKERLQWLRYVEDSVLHYLLRDCSGRVVEHLSGWLNVNQSVDDMVTRRSRLSYGYEAKGYEVVVEESFYAENV